MLEKAVVGAAAMAVEKLQNHAAVCTLEMSYGLSLYIS
jgi:hypothetical protein